MKPAVKENSETITDKSKHGYWGTIQVYHPLIFFFALLLLAAFPHQYPHAAFPLNAIFINTGLIAVLACSCIAGFSGVKINRESRILAYLYGAFLLWCIIRNQFAPVPALGRPFIGMLLEGFWLMAGTILLLSLEKSPGSSEERPFGKIIPDSQNDFSMHSLSLQSLAFFYFIILAIIFCFSGIHQYFTGFEKQLSQLQETGLYGGDDPISQGIIHALRERRVTAGFGNPNLFAAFLCLCLPFFLFFITEKISATTRLFSLAGLILVLFVIILTRSRGGLLSMGFAFFIFGAFRLTQSKKSPSAGQIRKAVLLALGCLAILVVFVIIQNATRSRGIRNASFMDRIISTTTIKERIYYYRTGWEIIKRYFIFGAAPAGYGYFYPMFRCPGARETQYAHNFIIHLWAETGLIGLILFLAFSCYAVKIAVGRLHSKKIIILPLTAFLTFLFNSLFEYTFLHGPIFGDFCLCAGLMVGGFDAQPKPVKGRIQLSARITKSYILFLIPVALTFLFAPSYSLRPFIAATYAQFGDDYSMENDLGRSHESYLAAVRYQPDHPWYFHRLGKTSMLLGDPFKSEEYLKKAIEISPHSGMIRDELGQLYRSTFRLNKALEMTHSAIEAYPLKSIYYYHLAQILKEQGKKEEARQYAQRAIDVELDPEIRRRYEEFLKGI